MTGEPTPLHDRVRSALAQESPLREVSMFGGRAFMVREAMVVCAMRTGDLLVRVPKEDHEDLVGRTGAAQAEMGTGRSMGPGWISVDATAVASDEDLAAWMDVALAFNRVLTTTS